MNHLYNLGFDLEVYHWILYIVMTQMFCSMSKIYSVTEKKKGLDYNSLFLDGVVIISWHSTSDSAILILEFELVNNTFLLVIYPVNSGSLSAEESPSPFEFKAWGQIQIAQIPFVSCC